MAALSEEPVFNGLHIQHAGTTRSHPANRSGLLHGFTSSGKMLPSVSCLLEAK